MARSSTEDVAERKSGREPDLGSIAFFLFFLQFPLFECFDNLTISRALEVVPRSTTPRPLPQAR